MMGAAGDESAASFAYAGEPDEAIKARIDVLTQQITNTRNKLWPSIKAMLSSEQLQQLQYMRDGQLVISSNASTDLPEPAPPSPPSHPPTQAKAPANRSPAAPPPSRPFLNPSLIPHSIAAPVMYTTKQL